VDFPFGKKARSLEAAIYLSLGSKKLVEMIKNDVLFYLNEKNIYFKTMPFVVFKVLNQIFKLEEKGAVFVELGGEITEVFIVSENKIEEISSLNEGENFFLRRLSSALNLSFAEARIILGEYQRKEVEARLGKKISKVLKTAKKDWLVFLKRLLEGMSEERLLPQRFYFCGNRVLYDELKNSLAEGEFSKLTVLSKPVEFYYWSEKSL
jgi:cell division ATPase FtsA